MLETDPLPPRKAQKKPWELLYDPELLLEEHGPLHIEDYRLNEEEMYEWATLCTMIRATFRNQAQIAEQLGGRRDSDGEFVISELAKRIEKGQLRTRKIGVNLLPFEFRNYTLANQRYRVKNRPKLTVYDKLEIADRVIQGDEPVKDLAKEYRVTSSCISQIVSMVRKKPKILEELIEKAATKEIKDETLACYIVKHLEAGMVIERAADLQKSYEVLFGIHFKLHRVRKVMRDLLDMRYKKIVKIPQQGNSERCLVQRQQSSLRLLPLFQRKKRLISIDETWLDTADFRRRSWQKKGTSNSIPTKKVNPRITLIVAFDSLGKIYASLL